MSREREIRNCFRGSDNGDAWGRCMTWWFALADYMYDHDMVIPDEWEFRHGLSSDVDSFEYSLLDEEGMTASECRRFGNALSRLARRIKSVGRDY